MTGRRAMARLVAAGLLVAGPALADPPSAPPPDPEHGKALFRACSLCHTLTPDGGNRAGPTLWALFGRPAGSVPGYRYSEALKNSGIVWDENTVSRLFEAGPDTVTPGSKMPLQTIPSASDRADLVAYLREVTTPP
ncbi:c-type cytochrome [Azospirillum rugosum]|uniref:Cytochrome c n=1 Tax=Azospirillum rugosum TaxID=416170 RepID=A0ABS4SFY9_9PROT|nr:c-type cytochrome [Azospirillum rugosum]MBP2290350.1 cytochrome c [Azospirillum rugosum]MDQ0527826.1 cytochrome c [Azospirillum rugosum]